MNVELLTDFLEMCLLINAGILLFTFLAMMVFKSFIVKQHGTIFGLSEHELQGRYFSYFAHFKVLIIVFNLTPYLALKIIA
ncbi:MAG: hypothetical protein P8I38_02695 [Arenicella sp.]|jgi:hypothetical protein|nr:hypothetical protein [Arenicella sp.]HAU67819.1 hypothetical protein [Gammaproteobacteria bacterium]